ncbi:MAG: hypothetical protein COV59_03710 [Candidatus Magasanikbacteria bacterium CG11_big_fil_rev_8_21_14_0_20_39_34]|uniref:Sulfatase-modifying factor enzyme-like domain-containing protein n=1 Tax=Candidatus Magasanikbacteria bacterium CG11_big_fil_rev_8_21_14_0_20_39_34 TaxID=1974653 RepID=A0A2H0N5U9_9BACT|nr:MAG: hypothetical protein COV59_03710 [Candidatus Magasanikbacteria bacterium CG11_big_fil_rev_8_21_14_0_20_39_34]
MRSIGKGARESVGYRSLVMNRFFTLVAACLFSFLLGGCLPSLEDECNSDRDCPRFAEGATCRVGICLLGTDAAPTDAAMNDDGADGTNVPTDAATDAATDATPDAAMPDAEVPDAEVPDAEVPDAEVPDATPDAAMPDAALTDADIPDSSPPCEDSPSFGADCETGMPGACAIGTMECELGELACVPATEPTDEVCDGLDNDCDEQIDEGFDLQADPSHCGACGRTCSFEHATPACVAGVCQIEQCDQGQVDLDERPDNGCEYHCTPTQEGEACGDEIDNDCDGSVDEECACDPHTFQPAPCNAQGEVGACRNGTSRCQNGNGSRVVCEPSQPQDEACDGIDNDCDGSIDEGLRNACGECGEVPAETCNGRDDNCDGQIDEGFDLGTACSVGRGACRDTGIRVCNAGGDGVVCDASEGQPTEEICDGVDNDCDGNVDNGVQPPADQACLCGQGEMQILGTFECRGGAGWECTCECTPAPEVCDGLDNNCNDQTDEGFDLQADPENCGACGHQCPVPANTSPLCVSGGCSFACRPGFSDINGVPEDGCERNCVPSGPEVCDGVDNDCNGQVDEDLGGGACQTGELGPCVSGTNQCRNGVLVCVRNVNPSPEVCDGVDNDCDGDTDLDDPDYSPPVECETGLPGPCSVGYSSCVDGLETCESMGPTPETCDGVDNNCDGIVDNVDGAGEICFSGGIGACREEGQMVCGPDGSLLCDAQPGAPSIELCNGIDDDCDGSVDEGMVRLGNFCLARTEEAGVLGIPITGLTYPQAQQRCEQLGGRLPTLDELTLAAFGQGRNWPWGNQPGISCGNAVIADRNVAGGTPGCGTLAPMAVCSHPSGNTPEGLCDLFGNVFEYVSNPDVVAGGSFANAIEHFQPGVMITTGWNDHTPSPNVGVRCSWDWQGI